MDVVRVSYTTSLCDTLPSCGDVRFGLQIGVAAR